MSQELEILDIERANDPLPDPPDWFVGELEKLGGFKLGRPVLRVVKGNDPHLVEWRFGKLRPKYPIRHETKIDVVGAWADGRFWSREAAIKAGLLLPSLSPVKHGVLVVVEQRDLYTLLPRYVIETLVFESRENWEANRWAEMPTGERIDVLGPFPEDGALYLPLLVVEKPAARDGKIGTVFRELGEDIIEELRSMFWLAKTKGAPAVVQDWLERQEEMKRKAEEELKSLIIKETDKAIKNPVSVVVP